MDAFAALDNAIQQQRQQELHQATGAAARRARYAARNANRISDNHCPEGHEYTPENTYYTASRRRMCLTCHAARRTYKHLASTGSGRYKGRPVIDLRELTRDDA